MSEAVLNGVNLDKVLNRFNIFDRYHAVVAACITLAFIYDAIIINNYIFVAEEVRYRCADINDTHAIEGASFNDMYAEGTTDICSDTETCTLWIYENPNSFVAEFELACQDWKRNLVGTVHNFGYMFGLLLIGPLSDKFGRKPSAILSGVASGVCGLARSFTSIYWIYILFEFLEGAFGELHSPLFMLAIEMVPTKYRVKFTMICNLGFPIGGVFFPLIYWLISSWRTFLRVLYAPGLLFILAFFYLDESPRWHLSKGNIKEAINILNKAAKINKIEIEENLETLTYEKEDSSNFTTAIAETFRSRTLMRSCLVCMVWWIASVFVNYGLAINSVSLNEHKYVNYALVAAVQFPSFAITTYLMDKFNRKMSLICSSLACGVLCVSQPFVPNNLYWLSVLMYMMGKLLSCMFCIVIYFFTSELFPTNTRNSMHALCSAVGRIGGIAAPLTPLLMGYWSGLPTLLFGVASLIGGFVTFMVPETCRRPLPDTVSQAEALKNTQHNRFEENETSSSTLIY